MTDVDDREDHVLRELLRSGTPAPPIDRVDWHALHARTMAAAALPLRRRHATWWQVLGDVTMPTRVLAAAASVALCVAAGMLMPQRPLAVPEPAAFVTIEEDLTSRLPYSTVPLLASDADNADVIDALLLFPGEEW